MTEMVERVAKALWQDRWPDQEWNVLQRLNYMGHARAAIEAMREPDIDMVQAGWDARGEVCERYRAMIDEALKVQP